MERTVQVTDLWPAFTRRLRGFITEQCAGVDLAVVTVRVIVRRGTILQWQRPRATHFEPWSCNELLEALTTEGDGGII